MKTRGKPFERGNAGRPKGARNRATIAAEALLDGEAERLARKAVEKALEGDVAALRLCLERLVPKRLERPFSLKFSPINSAGDAALAAASAIEALARGELSAAEAESFVRVVDAYTRTLMAHEFEQRLTKLEAQNENGNPSPSTA